jgi:hypothetical protein
LTTRPESPTDAWAMHFVVKLLLKAVVRWINAHPD